MHKKKDWLRLQTKIRLNRYKVKIQQFKNEVQTRKMKWIKDFLR